MPDAARLKDPTSHAANPLMPGTGSPDVKIGSMPAWRAVPAGMGAGIEAAANAMKDLMSSPSLDPATTPAKLAQINSSLMQDAGNAEANGAPGASASTTSGFTSLMATNVTLTTAYTAAAAVPGGEPAAKTAYTEGIKAAAATFASAAMSAIAGVTDVHICPVPCPIPPHGPGVVTKGSKSVLINNLPAVRKGDKVFEACGGEDPIAMGEMTVLIGDDGGGPGAPTSSPATTSDAQSQKQSQAQSTEGALAAAAASGVPLIEVCQQCREMAAAANDRRFFVAFQVVDDETGRPRPGVRLKIHLPDGTEREAVTDGDGTIMIDDLESPGACDVTCDLDDASNNQTFDFVRMESRTL